MTYSPFRHIGSVFWKRRPIQLSFFLTKRCTGRCPFCFYLSNKDDTEDEVFELSLSEIGRLSSSLGRLLWLAFSGGEIFLRDDLLEITKLFYEKNRPAIILFPTNGHLTDIIRVRIEEILRFCKKSTIVVKLSLEGSESLHDSIRGARGGFQRTMSTYKALGELLDRYPNFEMGINTVFCSKNQDHMDELIKYISGLKKIRTHTVSLIRGEVSDPGLKDIDREKYHETINKIALHFKKGKYNTYAFRGGKFKAAQDILQRRLIYETMLQKRRLIPCFAGKLNLVLTESGDLYPCESFSLKMGNVRQSGYDVNRLLKTKRAQEVIHSIEQNGCFCTHECYFMTNILFNASMYPALLRQYIQL
ncbi:MAG: radical SAM protein [Candidatus Hydrothermarchaeales archaeon]